MADLHIKLIDQLNDASGTVGSALDAITSLYGCGDELFDRLVEAQAAIDAAASRLQSEADTYGEMAYFGI